MTTKRKSSKTSIRKTAQKKSKLPIQANAVSEKFLGKKIPTLLLHSTQLGPIKLPDALKDQWTILYFYPRDNTPGCTRQACTYRDENARFKSKGIRVFGVSADTIESHQKFDSKFSLKFPLLSDPDKKLSQALGVYRDKTLYGKVYKGINRDSFLIDPSGTIRRIWRKVDPVKSIEITLSAALEEKEK